MEKFLAVLGATLVLQLDLTDSCMLQVPMLSKSIIKMMAFFTHFILQNAIVQFDEECNLHTARQDTPPVQVYTPN